MLIPPEPQRLPSERQMDKWNLHSMVNARCLHVGRTRPQMHNVHKRGQPWATRQRAARRKICPSPPSGTLPPPRPRWDQGCWVVSHCPGRPTGAIACGLGGAPQHNAKRPFLTASEPHASAKTHAFWLCGAYLNHKPGCGKGTLSMKCETKRSRGIWDDPSETRKSCCKNCFIEPK